MDVTDSIINGILVKRDGKESLVHSFYWGFPSKEKLHWDEGSIVYATKCYVIVVF